MPDVSLSAKLDAVAQDASLGGTNAAAAGNTGASTTNGFLRWLRDWFYARTGRQTAANSMSVVQASDSFAVTYTQDFNGSLNSTYQLITTTTTATRSLRMSAACNATAYDIEYQVVASGAAAPTTTGQALLAGEDFLAGIPMGDIYARSATAQKLIVWSA
jgi:hypothetical protein